MADELRFPAGTKDILRVSAEKIRRLESALCEAHKKAAQDASQLAACETAIASLNRKLDRYRAAYQQQEAVIQAQRDDIQRLKAKVEGQAHALRSADHEHARTIEERDLARKSNRELTARADAAEQETGRMRAQMDQARQRLEP